MWVCTYFPNQFSAYFLRGLRRYKLMLQRKEYLGENFYVFFAYSMTERWWGVRMLANLISQWRKRSALMIISILVSDGGQGDAWLDAFHSSVRKFSAEPQQLCESLQEMSSWSMYSPKILAFIFDTSKQNIPFHHCTVDIQPPPPFLPDLFYEDGGGGSSRAKYLQ